QVVDVQQGGALTTEESLRLGLSAASSDRGAAAAHAAAGTSYSQICMASLGTQLPSTTAVSSTTLTSSPARLSTRTRIENGIITTTITTTRLATSRPNSSTASVTTASMVTGVASMIQSNTSHANTTRVAATASTSTTMTITRTTTPSTRSTATEIKVRPTEVFRASVLNSTVSFASPATASRTPERAEVSSWLGCFEYDRSDMRHFYEHFDEHFYDSSSTNDCSERCHEYEFIAVHNEKLCMCMLKRPDPPQFELVADLRCGSICRGETHMLPERFCGTSETYAVYRIRQTPQQAGAAALSPGASGILPEA
ncbi:unnamed protein product, partial [Prorocentrum cordatum]